MRATPACLLLALLASGCPADDDDDSGGGVEIPEFVDAAVRLSDAELEAGDEVLLEGATVRFGDQQVDTDTNGRASVTVPSQDPFELDVSLGGYADHVLAGLAGIADFPYPARMVSRNTLGEWLVALGTAPDTDLATLVVTLETIARQPAQGAIASIDLAGDPPFILVDGEAMAGNELVFGSDSMVVFSNVQPGTATVQITAPEGDSCLATPALLAAGDLRTFELPADRVVIAPFLCQ